MSVFCVGMIYIPLCLYLYEILVIPNWEITDLHSTMFIFISESFVILLCKCKPFTFHYVYIYIADQPICKIHRCVIYIPLCLYLYVAGLQIPGQLIIIYIPLCLYLYGCFIYLFLFFIIFTFHYVYIYILLRHTFATSYI